MAVKARVLVVANRTADSPELIAVLRQRALRAAARFTLLVPAVPYGLDWATDMKAGRAGAASRAESGAARMRMSGIEVDAALVGDPDPLAAAGDLLHDGRFDEVIVSTLPRVLSRWLRLSLPDRLRRTFSVPVTQVTTHPRPARGGTWRRPAVAAH